MVYEHTNLRHVHGKMQHPSSAVEPPFTPAKEINVSEPIHNGACELSARMPGDIALHEISQSEEGELPAV